MTKIEFFTQISNNNEINIDIREFAKQELHKLQQTSTTNKYQDIKNNILNEMQEGVWYTISEMQKELPCCAEFSIQKISAIVREMVVTDKQIVRSAKQAILGTICIYRLA